MILIYIKTPKISRDEISENENSHDQNTLLKNSDSIFYKSAHIRDKILKKISGCQTSKYLMRRTKKHTYNFSLSVYLGVQKFQS